MVTGKTESEDIVDQLGPGANAYVTKPVNFAEALAGANAQIGFRRAERRAIAASDALKDANDNLEKECRRLNGASHGAL